MVSQSDAPAKTPHGDLVVLPFDSSWVDHVIGRINRLPIPYWLFYLLLLAIVSLLIVLTRWLEFGGPTGVLNSPYVIVGTYPVYFLAAIHYLDRTAAKAFDFFRPALGGSDAEAARLRYELTTLPGRPSWIAALIGFAIFVAVFAYPGEPRSGAGTGIAYWMMLAVSGAGFVLSAELLYHTFRQLMLVSRIHASAKNLRLFHFAPLYSFSALTARTGMVFILLLVCDLFVIPDTLSNVPLEILNVVILLLCVACFLSPLQGMHQRIVVEKRNLEFDVNQRVEVIVQHLYGNVDGLDLRDADAVNQTISSLVAARELIAKIPTWPWRAETFTVFFSALTLPVIVYLIQMVLKTIIGFK